MANSGPNKATRDLVCERDGWRCQRCGNHCDPRSEAYHSLQHRVSRGMGGSSLPWVNSPANLVFVCGSATTGCHGLIEANPNLARADGFRVDRGTEPQTVPYRRFDGAWVYLWDDGSATEQPSLSEAFWAGWAAHGDYKRSGAGYAPHFGGEALARLIPQPSDASLLDEVQARQRGEAS